MFTASPTFADSQGGEAEELRRLFYVALTRAEKHLTISYSKFKEDGKEMEASMFIEELKSNHPFTEEHVVLQEEEIATFNLVRLLSTHEPVIDKMESDIIDKALDKFTMNVTALNNYLNCPLEFYYRNLILRLAIS